MKNLIGYSNVCELFLKSSGLFLILTVLFLLPGCDSGEKAVDNLTGHQAVKQYHETKDDIDDIVERQNEKLNSLDEEEDEEMLDE